MPLYFTVTVFATVGFGDINATSQTARVLVMVQMILDLIVLGLGIRIFAGAIQAGRQNLDNGPPAAPAPAPPPTTRRRRPGCGPTTTWGRSRPATRLTPVAVLIRCE